MVIRARANFSIGGYRVSVSSEHRVDSRGGDGEIQRQDVPNSGDLKKGRHQSVALEMNRFNAVTRLVRLWTSFRVLG
ncbi:unnamed protein product [Prunus armeniaca]